MAVSGLRGEWANNRRNSVNRFTGYVLCRGYYRCS